MQKEQTMRERFDSSGRSVVKYANAHGLSHHTVSRVLDGIYTGKRRDKNVVKVIEQLHADSIWIEPLPWDDTQTAS
jgi:hypothetical protein